MYTKDERQYSTKEPILRDIIDGINIGYNIWKYTEGHFVESYVKTLLESQGLKIGKRDFKRVEQSVFRKIRDNTTDRSPSHQQVPL